MSGRLSQSLADWLLLIAPAGPVFEAPLRGPTGRGIAHRIAIHGRVKQGPAARPAAAAENLSP